MEQHAAMEQQQGKSKLSDPETWVDRHGDYLYRCAMVRVRDRQIAEDIVQDTLLAALQARASFAGQSSERTWLVGILKHKVIDHIRRVSRTRPIESFEPFLAADEDESRLFAEDGHWREEAAAPADWGADPRTLTENKEFWEVMRKCLDRLPGKTAQVYTMREIDDVDGDEVCKALGVTPSNLWVLLHRARLRLRDCFETHWLGARP